VPELTELGSMLCALAKPIAERKKGARLTTEIILNVSGGLEWDCGGSEISSRLLFLMKIAAEEEREKWV
jgi:hypothetical protein